MCLQETAHEVEREMEIILKSERWMDKGSRGGGKKKKESGAQV